MEQVSDNNSLQNKGLLFHHRDDDDDDDDEDEKTGGDKFSQNKGLSLEAKNCKAWPFGVKNAIIGPGLVTNTNLA